MKKVKQLLFGLATLVILCSCGSKDDKTVTENEKNILNVAEDIELASMDSCLATDGYSVNAIAAT